MGRAAAAAAPTDPKAIMEARRAAYREEQLLPDVKWACFAEQRKHEDFAAVKFAQKQAALQAKSAKPDKKVTDFVRRIRRVLDKKSREHGGTEGTYLRECFLNWDADCSGTIDAIEFRKAIRSLGLDISQADASYLVGYYGGVESAYTSVAKDEMTYDLLIEDVVNASIHFLQPQPPIPQSARPDGPFPPVLRRFIKKVRQKLFTYITGKGENEQYLVRNAFLNWDKDASGSLSYDEFRARAASVTFLAPSTRDSGRVDETRVTRRVDGVCSRRQRHVAAEFSDVRRRSCANRRPLRHVGQRGNALRAARQGRVCWGSSFHEAVRRPGDDR